MNPTEYGVHSAAVAAAQRAADALHERAGPLHAAGLDLLFREARSQNGWQDAPISDQQLHALYDLLKMGPTSMNCCPARFVFVRSQEGRRRLRPAINPGNLAKTLAAPVIVIVAYDLEFYRELPMLFPHTDAQRFFADQEDHAAVTAMRNGTLQGAYLMFAARALGLDCGPMSGFNNALVDAEFFPDSSIRSNFLCGLGRGDSSKLFQRLPRLSFKQACELL